MSASLAGAVTGHELIHRRSPAQRWLGRVLLASVLYEHFYTEHLRGHHVRVGTAADLLERPPPEGVGGDGEDPPGAEAPGDDERRPRALGQGGLREGHGARAEPVQDVVV